MKEFLKAIRKLFEFYAKNIKVILFGSSLMVLLVFVLALMEWFTNSFPVVSLIICVLIFFAANKITKRKAL